MDVNDCTVGIVGHGQVGTRVETKLTALGCQCLVNDPPKAKHSVSIDYVDLQTALDADIVTVHTPLTTTGDYPTKNLIGADAIDRMRSCRLLINAARGGIVDEQALMARLEQDTQFNVQIDCWQDEPQINLELVAKCYLCSPHVAGHSVEARLNATRQLADALSDWSGIRHSWTAGATQTEEISADLEIFAPGHRPGHRLGHRNEDAMLATIMQQFCPVTEIDKATRGLLTSTPDKRAQDFDRLRRQFAARREFSFSVLPIAVSSAVSQNTLNVLGFRF